MGEASHLVINVGDVHCVEHIKVEVIFEYSAQYVKWNVRPTSNQINHNVKNGLQSIFLSNKLYQQWYKNYKKNIHIHMTILTVFSRFTSAAGLRRKNLNWYT